MDVLAREQCGCEIIQFVTLDEDRYSILYCPRHHPARVAMLEAGSNWQSMVHHLHEVTDICVGSTPDFRDLDLRAALIVEEVTETLTAMGCRWSHDEKGRIALVRIDGAAMNFPEAIDGIVDSLVVLVGTAITFGVDLKPIFEAVHAANMAKAGGPKREDGKQLKPAGWKPPDVAGLLKAQGWKGES
jgi:predicted HAD superfamily Cof-like phosphohydrolase